MLKEIKNLRTLLKIPKNIRIAQHIYNKFRDYEDRMEVSVKSKFGDKIAIKDYSSQGIDIFYVDDDEFIKRFLKE